MSMIKEKRKGRIQNFRLVSHFSVPVKMYAHIVQCTYLATICVLLTEFGMCTASGTVPPPLSPLEVDIKALVSALPAQWLLCPCRTMARMVRHQ